MNLENYEYTGIIITGIVIIFLIRLAVGYYASKKINSATDYVVAGRRLPIYFTGASIMATWFAAETLMGASSTAYQWGFQGVLFDPFGAVLCLLLSGFFFIRIMRRARYLTAIDFFEKRYGRTMAIAGGFTQLIAYFGWTAAQIVAGGAILHVLMGWQLPVGMIFVTVIVVLYTMMGGMWADTLLDFMQMFITAGGILLLFFAVLNHAGGWQVFKNIQGVMYVSKAFTIMPIQDEGFLGYQGHTAWLYWLAAWMSIGLGSLPAQDLMQRSMSAKNEATAVHGTYLAGIMYGLFGILSPLIGIALFSIFPNLQPEQTEYIVISAAMKFMSPFLAAMFIAALTSALMSTSDSSILAGASIVTENILPMIKPGLDETKKLRWTRIMVAVIGFLSLLIALFAATIYKLAIFAWTVLLVGQVAPFILGIYWKKANAKGALAGYLGGFISWLCIMLVYYQQTIVVNAGDVDTALWDAAYISSVPAFVISIALMVIVSIMTQHSDPPQQLTDVDGELLALKKRLGILPLRDVL